MHFPPTEMLGVHRFFFVQVEARAEPTKYRPKMRRYFSDMTVSASLRPTGFPRLLVYQRMQFGSVANETFAKAWLAHGALVIFPTPKSFAFQSGGGISV